MPIQMPAPGPYILPVTLLLGRGWGIATPTLPGFDILGPVVMLTHGCPTVPGIAPCFWWRVSKSKTYSKTPAHCPGSCGSVGRTVACKLGSRRLDSWLGQMPGLSVRGKNPYFSPSLSPSFPISLKIIKILKTKQNKT